MRAFLLLPAFSLDLSAEVVGLDLFLLPPPAILYLYFCFVLNHVTACIVLCSELFHQELGALIRLKDTDAGLGFSLELFIHLTM